MALLQLQPVDVSQVTFQIVLTVGDVLAMRACVGARRYMKSNNMSLEIAMSLEGLCAVQPQARVEGGSNMLFC